MDEANLVTLISNINAAQRNVATVEKELLAAKRRLRATRSRFYIDTFNDKETKGKHFFANAKVDVEPVVIDATEKVDHWTVQLIMAKANVENYQNSFELGLSLLRRETKSLRFRRAA